MSLIVVDSFGFFHISNPFNLFLSTHTDLTTSRNVQPFKEIRMPIPLRLIKVEQSDASTVTQQTDIEKVDDKLEWLKMFSLIPVKQSVSGSATSNNGEGTRKRLADPACEASVIASDTIIKPKRSIVSTGKGGVSLAFEAKKDRLGTFGCTIHIDTYIYQFSPIFS